MIDLGFREYVEKQANRLLSGERHNAVLCYVSSSDLSDTKNYYQKIVNVKKFAEDIAKLGLYVRVEHPDIRYANGNVDTVYCFVISKKFDIRIFFSYRNPSFGFEIDEVELNNLIKGNE